MSKIITQNAIRPVIRSMELAPKRYSWSKFWYSYLASPQKTNICGSATIEKTFYMSFARNRQPVSQTHQREVLAGILDTVWSLFRVVSLNRGRRSIKILGWSLKELGWSPLTRENYARLLILFLANCIFCSEKSMLRLRTILILKVCVNIHDNCRQEPVIPRCNRISTHISDGFSRCKEALKCILVEIQKADKP